MQEFLTSDAMKWWLAEIVPSFFGAIVGGLVVYLAVTHKGEDE
jgi:hypothetical protein|nr:MAG TPA: YtxH-like protein [Caudoviricetes sp.]